MTKNDELLEEIKKYWAKHLNIKSLGSLLDRVMVLNGNVKDISYISNEEWMAWFKQIDMFETIDSEVLNKLRVNRLKVYHSSEHEKEKYGKEPSPLFIDGEFNKNNFFGGDDDLIRSYFTEISENEALIEFPQVVVDIGDTTKTIGIFAQQLESTNYIHFFITLTGLDVKPVQQVFDIAVFGLRKDNLNTIDFCWFNGKPMNENEYCYLLNCIGATGFNFFQKNEEIDKNSSNT